MKLSIKQFFFIVSLILLATISSWLVYNNIFRVKEHDTRSSAQPTIILHNVTAINYTDTGNKKNSLQTKKLTYYASAQRSILSEPIILFYQQDKSPWRITASQGEALDNNTLIKLTNNVVITQKSGENNPESILETSTLRIFPNKHYAETQSPISYTQVTQNKAKIIIHSIGAKVYQDSGKIYLLSKTRGKYEANQ